MTLQVQSVQIEKDELLATLLEDMKIAGNVIERIAVMGGIGAIREWCQEKGQTYSREYIGEIGSVVLLHCRLTD